MKPSPTLLTLLLLTLALIVTVFAAESKIDSKNRKSTLTRPRRGKGPGGGRRRSLPRRNIDASLADRDNGDNDCGLTSLAARDPAASNEKVEASAGCIKCQSSLHFSTQASQKYAVGTDIPTLSLKTKNSWAGLMPVTKDGKNDFYFWLWGNDGENPSDEIVIWLNGGPGCSSLYGLVIENGPFLYPNKKEKPFVNPYSWTREAIMLFVEMPIGVGFTKGTSNTTKEEELAQQFATFLDNFFITFPELKGKKLYIAAESFGAVYASYIMNHLYDLGNKVNLQGGMFVSGLISTRTAQGDLVAYETALKWADTIKLGKVDLDAIKRQSDKCGYTGYFEKNLVYPPRGRLPSYRLDGCDTVNTLYDIWQEKDENSNPYRVTVPDPLNDDPLGNPFGDESKPNFFDNVQVQDYINAPHQKWELCNLDKVFFAGRNSEVPDQFPTYSHSLLSKAIERSPAGLMMLAGREDLVVIADGTSLVLQNLTWHDVQGFQSKPSRPLLDSKGTAVGVWTQERGLTYAIFDHAGHSIPSDAPETAFVALQVMLGRRTFPESSQL